VYKSHIQTWNLPSFEDVIYKIGNNSVWTVIKNGKIVVRKNA